MSTPDHDHELFGELRSLLHRPRKDKQWAKDLLDLLKLARNELGEEVYEQVWVAHLQRAPRASWPIPLVTCTSLEELELNASLLPVPCFALQIKYEALGNEGAKAIVASPLLALLTELDLVGNRITDDGAKAIAASPHLTHLTELYLTDNGIADDGAKAL
ncbi:MAG: leucine-rich repeat domain-containing protein, partial [Myxococcota bacterium]